MNISNAALIFIALVLSALALGFSLYKLYLAIDTRRVLSYPFPEAWRTWLKFHAPELSPGQRLDAERGIQLAMAHFSFRSNAGLVSIEDKLAFAWCYCQLDEKLQKKCRGRLIVFDGAAEQGHELALERKMLSPHYLSEILS
jgi:hypothetical protein